MDGEVEGSMGEGRDRDETLHGRGHLYIWFVAAVPFWGRPFPLSFSFTGAEIGSHREQSIEDVRVNKNNGQTLSIYPQPALRTKSKALSQGLGRCCEVC